MRHQYDKRKIAESFSRAAETYGPVAAIQRRNAEHLATIIRTHCPTLSRLSPFLEIGAGTGIFTEYLLQLGISHGIVTDIAPAMVATLQEKFAPFPCITPQCLDGESLALGTRFAAIFSASTFQWFSTLREPFLSYWNHIEPGGTFAFCMFVEGTLRELHTVTSIVGCRYPGHRLPGEKEALSAVLDARFIVEHFSVVETPLTYPSTHRRLSSLKAIGSTNLGEPLGAGDLRRVIRTYDESFRVPEGVTATFRTLYVLARKSH